MVFYYQLNLNEMGIEGFLTSSGAGLWESGPRESIDDRGEARPNEVEGLLR